MFKKILLPADGSEMAILAARTARTVAEKFGGGVTVLHVVQNYYTLPAFAVPDTVTIPLSVLQDLETAGQAILARTAEVFAGFAGRLETRLDYGPPGKTLVAAAAGEGHDLIVMGRRGLSGPAGLLLGSVSNHVVHYAPCPVLIVKGAEAQ